MVIVIEKNDALTDAVKDAGFERIQHPVGGIGKAAPVQQKSGKAVTADGVIQKTVYTFLRPEKEYAVYGHNGENSQNHKTVLGTVFLRDSAHFPNQQHDDRCNQRVGKGQMEVVKGLHLVAVHRDHCISRDIMNRDLIEGIDAKNENLKQCIQAAEPDEDFSGTSERSFGEINGKAQKTNEHHVNCGEIDAGHNGHAKIAAVENADQVADIHNGCPQTGCPQVMSGWRFFL